MSSLAISLIVFACIFAGALMGMAIRRALPEHHLNSESKETMKLGLGLIGTMSALVLGLLVSSAKTSYDTQKDEVTQMSAKLILLDRTLAHYERMSKEPHKAEEVRKSKEARQLLRASVASALAQMWPEDGSQHASSNPNADEAEALYDKIHDLTPENDAQRALQGRAQSIVLDLGETRWMLFEQSGSAIAIPYLIVLVIWLTLIFSGFGLLAPGNATVIATLLLCALSVSCAIFLIQELDRPFDGLIQISSEPLRKTLASLGN